MNNMENLLSLIDTSYGELKGIKELNANSLLSYFRNRVDVKYLFTIEDARALKDDEIIDEAEKVMKHDIFGHKFEGEIDYKFNPTDETSRDNEWSWSLFRTIYWQPLARAYALTGDERYTKEFIHQLHQFREVWPADEFIKDTTFVPKQPYPGTAWRTIEAGIRIYTTWLPCFEIFKHSDAWQDEDLAAFLLGIREHAIFLMSHYSNHDRSSNWLSMETTALFQIGVLFPEFKEAKEWRETGYHRVMHEIMYCFSDSGIHMEKTPIYHLVATISFMQAVRVASLNNIPIAPYAYEILTRAAEYVMSLIKPDLSTPMIGDADRDDLTSRKSDTSIYEGMNLSFFPNDLNELRAFFAWMYELSGKEEFKYFASLRREGKAPEKLDYKYAHEGIFVARSGWTEADDYILMHATQLERGEKSTHSHNDACHAEVTLLGEDILVDSGRYIYRSSIWKDWRAYFVSALAHNTLYCDDHEMGAVPGVDRVRGLRAICHEFVDSDEYKLIDISHNGYVFTSDSVYHRRKIYLLKNHTAVIVDYVSGECKEEHDFRLMFNFNKGDVLLDSNVVSYTTLKKTEFELSFYSDKEFDSYLLVGSEEPKGGWISYGYPVREPNGQVTFKRVSKAPFRAVSVVKSKGINSSVTFSDATIIVSVGDQKLTIKE